MAHAFVIGVHPPKDPAQVSVEDPIEDIIGVCKRVSSLASAYDEDIADEERYQREYKGIESRAFLEQLLSSRETG